MNNKREKEMMKEYQQTIQWVSIDNDLTVFDDNLGSYAAFGFDLPDFAGQPFAFDEVDGWWHQIYYDELIHGGCYVFVEVPLEHTIISHLVILPTIPPDEVRTCLNDEEADLACKEFWGET
jgi:hypothetical protein